MASQPRSAPEAATPAGPRLVEEMKKMETEYEPLLPVEKSLIWYTFGGGLVLLVVLVIISRAFF
ncbi:MAG: hypothetical protein ACE14M_02500 [Terriglobales bacterium]